jgi:hypothetical protein
VAWQECPICKNAVPGEDLKKVCYDEGYWKLANGDRGVKIRISMYVCDECYGLPNFYAVLAHVLEESTGEKYSAFKLFQLNNE